ncbi:GIY-YIG nuclease family protein [Salinimonas lutimaris]|uniref:GIY-YIG nuclease family protein n=1 Tax=Salinimonas lutimaris TaxID=914153 RepID=UPI0010C118E3|nr:GIY-YIG nuclease family protein [Salinimonas lutimaris]
MAQSIPARKQNEDTSTVSWFVYLIENRLGQLYTGCTTDPARRMRQHCGAITGGARALKGKGPLRFRAVLSVSNKSAALKLEYAIKQLSRAQKTALINGCSDTLPDHIFTYTEPGAYHPDKA